MSTKWMSRSLLSLALFKILTSKGPEKYSGKRERISTLILRFSFLRRCTTFFWLFCFCCRSSFFFHCFLDRSCWLFSFFQAASLRGLFHTCGTLLVFQSF